MPQILGQPYNTGSFACDIICLNQRARRALGWREGGGGLIKKNDVKLKNQINRILMVTQASCSLVRGRAPHTHTHTHTVKGS